MLWKGFRGQSALLGLAWPFHEWCHLIAKEAYRNVLATLYQLIVAVKKVGEAKMS